jgi:galactose mutarotase-like enzyme
MICRTTQGQYFNTTTLETTIKCGLLSATIRHMGAELISLKRNGKEYMWNGDPAFWGKHSPVLFPIVGTLKDNSYFHDGKKYSLPRHGFARERNFEVFSQDEDKVSFSLKADNVTYEVYPFNFELILTYVISDDSLSIEYSVENLSGDVMPFSLGAHPAFALNGNFEDYSLYFDADESLTRYKLENDLVYDSIETIKLEKGNLPLTYSLFKDDALVMKQLSSKEITIEKSKQPYLTLKYHNFPHMGLWTKTGASFICIEPWQGYADTHSNNGNLSDKEGVINLLPGSKAFFSLRIEIQDK